MAEILCFNNKKLTQRHFVKDNKTEWQKIAGAFQQALFCFTKVYAKSSPHETVEDWTLPVKNHRGED